ncbi:MAG: bifunctional diaminohydroxyphosphoribosylaminopyrimidine deaminase/5-amino-6-(5-phosphoribosylamino)uracil reductase RibD [Planctomycetaceae bacterium]|nr:bifunctional diaminohydroxyphosphoribosylaminopyrimidine deaminase/5-amino-6-(5-phosphoribosylamino)uracil reductase RibD [Planctomycetaceae bacterium]
MNTDLRLMQRAVELARYGQGFVEPNPMVGCVIVKDGNIIGEGFHRRFGSAHAEVEAINNAESAGFSVADADCYVTLEPCSHFGKTPPCAYKLVESGIKRVIAAMKDPNHAVNGRGFKILREAGIEVVENVLENEVRSLNAPYLTRLEKQRPWFIAKWAMTADGRIAAKTGSSNWISGDDSRRLVHRLRSRMDAILVGSGTARQDNCRLNVRLTEEEQADETIPKRIPMRIVLNSGADIPPDGFLVQTAREIPVLVVVSEDAPEKNVAALEKLGCRIFRHDLSALFQYLVKKGDTNVLIEGGGKVFGMFFDRKLIDEVHIFLAPRIIGGANAIPPLAGDGLETMDCSARIVSPQYRVVGDDVYLTGRVDY